MTEAAPAANKALTEVLPSVYWVTTAAMKARAYVPRIVQAFGEMFILLLKVVFITIRAIEYPVPYIVRPPPPTSEARRALVKLRGRI